MTKRNAYAMRRGMAKPQLPRKSPDLKPLVPALRRDNDPDWVTDGMLLYLARRYRDLMNIDAHAAELKKPNRPSTQEEICRSAGLPEDQYARWVAEYKREFITWGQKRLIAMMESELPGLHAQVIRCARGQGADGEAGGIAWMGMALKKLDPEYGAKNINVKGTLTLADALRALPPDGDD